MDFDDDMIKETVGFANKCNVTIITNNDESVLITGTHPDIFTFLCDFHGGQSINENEMHEMIENSVI